MDALGRILGRPISVLDSYVSPFEGWELPGWEFRPDPSPSEDDSSSEIDCGPNRPSSSDGNSSSDWEESSLGVLRAEAAWLEEHKLEGFEEFENVPLPDVAKTADSAAGDIPLNPKPTKPETYKTLTTNPKGARRRFMHGQSCMARGTQIEGL